MGQDINAAMFYSFLLALQFGLQPMISQRCTRTDVSKTTIVVATELTKIVIAAVSIACCDNKERSAKVFENWSVRDSLKVAALPATLYAIQNLLVQHAYEYLPSMTFNLLNQTKTLSAALWLYILMGKAQSYMQMVALLLLLSAAVILNMDRSSGGNHDTPFAELGPNHSYGIVFVLVASMLSGISAALTQKVLTSSGRQRSPLFLSAELAVYGILFLACKELYQALSSEDSNALLSGGEVLQGWDMYTLIPVLTNALGGLVVGLVTKHAGGVIKGFALVAGLLFTGVAQWVVDGTPLDIVDWTAAVLVSVAIIIHTSFPPPPAEKETKKD